VHVASMTRMIEMANPSAPKAQSTAKSTWRNVDTPQRFRRFQARLCYQNLPQAHGECYIVRVSFKLPFPGRIVAEVLRDHKTFIEKGMAASQRPIEQRIKAQLTNLAASHLATRVVGVTVIKELMPNNAGVFTAQVLECTIKSSTSRHSFGRLCILKAYQVVGEGLDGQGAVTASFVYTSVPHPTSSEYPGPGHHNSSPESKIVPQGAFSSWQKFLSVQPCGIQVTPFDGSECEVEVAGMLDGDSIGLVSGDLLGEEATEGSLWEGLDNLAFILEHIPRPAPDPSAPDVFAAAPVRPQSPDSTASFGGDYEGEADIHAVDGMWRGNDSSPCSPPRAASPHERLASTPPVDADLCGQTNRSSRS